MFFERNQWHKITFLLLGLLIFSWTSTLETNYLLRNYLLIIEIKTALLVFYWLSSQKRKRETKIK